METMKAYLENYKVMRVEPGTPEEDIVTLAIEDLAVNQKHIRNSVTWDEVYIPKEPEPRSRFNDLIYELWSNDDLDHLDIY
jgi:hypothetical protein